MILLIDLCTERLHAYEFVRPIESILKQMGASYFTKQYREITSEDLDQADKIILSGTSLADAAYLDFFDSFSWLKDFEKPILGICAGMQVLTHFFGGSVLKRGASVELGMTPLVFDRSFLGLLGDVEVYSLHQFGVGADESKMDVFARSQKSVQAVRWKGREAYGVLFHPEARNKVLIEEFVKL